MPRWSPWATGATPPPSPRRSAFVDAWDGQIAVVVDWPPPAASWLRTAQRLTANDPDAWVIADTSAGWEPVGAPPARDRPLGPDAYRDGAMTESLFARPPVEIAPGAVHVPGFLTLERQRELVAACRGWARRGCATPSSPAGA